MLEVFAGLLLFKGDYLFTYFIWANMLLIPFAFPLFKFAEHEADLKLMRKDITLTAVLSLILLGSAELLNATLPILFNGFAMMMLFNALSIRAAGSERSALFESVDEGIVTVLTFALSVSLQIMVPLCMDKHFINTGIGVSDFLAVCGISAIPLIAGESVRAYRFFENRRRRRE